MAKLVSTLLRVVNIFLVALYLLVCLIPFLPTGKYWMVALLGLVFPFLFFGVLAFLILWSIARSKWAFLSLIALILSWKQISVIFGFHSKKFTIAKNDETLRVLSWNLSAWGESSKSRSAPNCDQQMTTLIAAQQPDVLCLQEFYDRAGVTRGYSMVRILQNMGFQYAYFVRTTIKKTNYSTGVAILSKYPIADTAKFSYGENDYAEHLIFADIFFQGQKVRVFTTHLQSVRFEGQEYSTLRKIENPDESRLKGSRTVVNKLKVGYHYRGSEADLANEKIRESPYPAIVCGDFNDVPNSYTYFKIKDDLQDAFLKKGNGIGRTFRYLSPTLRIDYILADKKFKVEQFNRIIAPYSDHYPIVADLTLPGTAP
ncbi:MAG: endonuclease/exonuclease/phosphatase family protein [Ferruginibacter sp.]